MKYTLTLVTIFIIICFTTPVKAQLSDGFNQELMALIKADIKSIKGQEIEKQQGLATIYASNLKLGGFEVTYTTTQLGNELRAKYLQQGSDAVMDALAEKFLELPFAKLDSKKDKKILGTGLFASTLKRKIKLVDMEGKVFLTAELNTDDLIHLFFAQ